jgi:hypothetical protein
MLPVDDINKLHAGLGLPKGTITKKMMRNDETGFCAALFRDKSTGKLILAGRDTQLKPQAAWQVNTRNGQGLDTPRYEAMRELTLTLNDENINFNLAGYSKGGWLVQEAALVSDQSKIYVFNSVGLHKNCLAQIFHALKRQNPVISI